MDTWYRVDTIEGKGLGCIALQDIKMGTLILEEKPQCQNTTSKPWASLEDIDIDVLMESFQGMETDDKNEYSKLHNAFSESDELTAKILMYIGDPDREKIQLYQKIIGIYKTNSFIMGGVGIQCSKFNHSCSPNAEIYWNKNKNEIRAVYEIKTGEEITINYSCQSTSMKDRKKRQDVLSKGWNFDCKCDLCEKEAVQRHSNEELYQEFEKLKQKARQLLASSGEEGVQGQQRLEMMKKEVSCRKELYKLAKSSCKSLVFLESVLDEGFRASAQGYLQTLLTVFKSIKKKQNVLSLPNKKQLLKQFQKECDDFSKEGEDISTTVFGDASPRTTEWIKRRHNFEIWIKEYAMDGLKQFM